VKAEMRFRPIEPRDVSPEQAARRLGVDYPLEFNAILPNLLARGFPAPDPDTKNFDLDAIDAWRKARHPHLFGGGSVLRAANVVAERIAKMRRR
jgi:hypothetical protein